MEAFFFDRQPLVSAIRRTLRYSPINRDFRYGLPFLLNFCNDLVRYYRHIRKNSDYRHLSIPAGSRRTRTKRVETTMSSRTILSALGALAIVMTLASVAAAQHYQPFIEPGYFNYDLQLFAPAADIDTYDGDPVLRTGWFGSYNRMYIGVSRPRDSGYPVDVGRPTEELRTYPDSSDLMDLTWGNRWDLGYMVDDVDHDHGWLFSYMHIDGPNVGNIVLQQRLNRLNEDDEGFVIEDGRRRTTTTSSSHPRIATTSGPLTGNASTRSPTV